MPTCTRVMPYFERLYYLDHKVNRHKQVPVMSGWIRTSKIDYAKCQVIT